MKNSNIVGADRRHVPSPLTVYKASAGSGKTFTLATEYIKLLVRNPQNYKKILAVTFTNKATEEMKMRILSQLYGIWQGHAKSQPYLNRVMQALGDDLSEPQVRQRAGEALHLLLHNYSYFRVETIDSFFQSVMRNLARELNLTANLRVELNDAQVEDLAVDQLVDSLSASDQMLQWLMRYIMDNIGDDRSWNVIGQVKKFGLTIFHDYYKEHSEQMNLLMADRHFFDNYQRQLRQIRQQSLERMRAIGKEFLAALDSEGLSIADLNYGRSGVAGLFVKLGNGVFDESVLTKRAAECLEQPEKWCKRDHPRRAHIAQLAETTLMPLLRKATDEQPRQWKLYKSADLTLRHLSQLRLLGNIERKVRQLNEDQNRFLLSDTQQLLHELIDDSDTPFIFEKIGTQLENIMIDEFQDTSTVQWQNFKVLLQETMSQKGSENLIVGDVKQSIYRWRSGDWRLLADIERQFPHPADMLSIEPLDTNYRSARRVVAFNNTFFKIAAQQEGVPAYDDVEQHVPEGSPDTGHVEVALLPANDYEPSTLQYIARRVADLIGQGHAPADIAILVRTNSRIPLIANFLMEQLPHVKVVSDEAFRLDASPAVNTIVGALRFLAHPDDCIAQACLSKACSGQIDGALPTGFSPELLNLPLYELAERLHVLFATNWQEEQSAYLCAFFDQVARYAGDHDSNIDGFLELWDESLGAKTIQSPETDGLRIISIHKSKGLEFPCVIIPFCDWQLELPDILWCEPAEEPFRQLPIAPIDFSQKGMKGTIYEPAYEEEHQQNLVDNLNLLYVGFTRASHHLTVIGKRKATAKSRSALIEQVLPQLSDEIGGELTGTDQADDTLLYTYEAPAATSEAPAGNSQPTSKQAGEGLPESSPNPFLMESTPVKVGIELLTPQAAFRQSNKSREFASGDDDDAEARQKQYIQLGSVLHSVLSSIHTTDDVDQALLQLEQDGILYDSHLTREHIINMLRKRLASPQAAQWFKPGRWTLFNECTILTTDAATGRVVERRPDRVMTDGEETIVVDFKFGRERADYHDQVGQYMHLLSQMGHQNVKGFLWFVYSNKIVEVKPSKP